MAIASHTRAPNRIPKYDANSGLVTSALAIVPTGTTGAPASGTWIAGTIIIDSAGVLWKCTASGTPGTWVTLIPSDAVVSSQTYTPRGTAGAPTSGTWAVGALVLDSANVFWKCTVAGTPGTWVNMLTGAQAPSALPAGTSMFLPLVSSVADTSGNARTTSVVGTASYGGSPPYGAAAAHIASAFQVLISESTLFNCGAGDLTVAFWMKGTLSASFVGIFSCATDGGWPTWNICWDGSGSRNWVIYPGGGSGGSPVWNFGNGGLSDADMGAGWHHYAFTRQSTALKFWLDGVLKTTVTTGGENLNQQATTGRIGSARGSYTGWYPDCYLQQFIYAKTTALWTADFTPPTYL